MSSHIPLNQPVVAFAHALEGKHGDTLGLPATKSDYAGQEQHGCNYEQQRDCDRGQRSAPIDAQVSRTGVGSASGGGHRKQLKRRRRPAWSSRDVCDCPASSVRSAHWIWLNGIGGNVPSSCAWTSLFSVLAKSASARTHWDCAASCDQTPPLQQRHAIAAR